MNIYVVYELTRGYHPRLLTAYTREEFARERVQKERDKAKAFNTAGEYYYQEVMIGES